MVAITFANPLYLWLLIIVPIMLIIHYFALRKKKEKSLKFSNFAALEKVVGNSFIGLPLAGIFRNGDIIMIFLRFISMTSLILGLAGLIIWYEGATSNYDFVIAIDSSASMLANDMSPNRVEAAKNSAVNFLEDAGPGTQIGLVTFAEDTYVLVNLTTDVNKVRSEIVGIDGKLKGGTDIGTAIVTSSTMLGKSERKKVIILMTDGQTNEGLAVDKSLNFTKSRNVVVYTIGIGTSQGGNVSDFFVSQLDEASLLKVADYTGGSYFRARNPDDMKTAFNIISEKTVKNLSKDVSYIFFLIGISVLFIEWWLLSTVYATIP